MGKQQQQQRPTSATVASSSSSSTFQIPNSFLVWTVCIQWVLFTVLLYHRQQEQQQQQQDPAVSATTASSVQQQQSSLSLSLFSSPIPTVQKGGSQDGVDHQTTTKITSPDGVAIALLNRAPKWFHLRYTVMIHNALSNIPPDWAVQLFVNEKFLRDDVYPFQPGLVRLIQHHPRVIATPLPAEMTKMKPKQIYTSTWLWERCMADRVVTFSGNGAFCGNHPEAERTWLTLSNDYDFVGVPSFANYGVGGDGSTHSFRNRPAMLRVLHHVTAAGVAEALKSKQEHRFFVDAMMEMNKRAKASSDESSSTTTKTTMNFRLAPRAATEVLGGGLHNISSNGQLLQLPLVVSGTQSSLSWEERDLLLKHCPEIKIIFPSLHEPACFGAHPNGAKCKTSICALQNPLPKSGC